MVVEQLEQTNSVHSRPPLGGVLTDTAEGGGDPAGDVDLAESIRSTSAPLQGRQRITVMTTFPNAVASGRLTGENSDWGYPLWLQGTHWSPQGGPPILVDPLECDCEVPTEELADIEQTQPPCGNDRASAYRLAAQGFEGKCLPKASEWMPREKLERQTSIALAGLIAEQAIAATALTGYQEDGVTDALDDEGNPLPKGDRSAGEAVCAHKAFGVLESAREYRGDGTLGALIITSALKWYLTAEKKYVVRVGNHWETQDGDRVLFAPANKVTGPLGQDGLWIYSVNAVDWVLTDIELMGTIDKTRKQARGNRNPIPPAGRYGLVRVDSAESYAVEVVAGCESDEGVIP